VLSRRGNSAQPHAFEAVMRFQMRIRSFARCSRDAAGTFPSLLVAELL